MKAIVITTVNIPRNIIDFIEKADSEWLPIIVGDLKSPHEEIEKICKQVKGIYLGPEKQMKLGFTHAAAIPWNCYDRKNLGYLFAYKEGAEIIFSTDDDNYPIDDGWDKEVKLGKQELVVVSSSNGWYNSLIESDIKVTPRGFPYWLINDIPQYIYENKEVDVAIQVGLWLGDPDVDAMTRIIIDPKIKTYGFNRALAKNTMCPYNSQNTFISREMLPAHMVWCGDGTSHYRFDDIYASFVAQVIAFHRNKTIKFGYPLVRQRRNEHDLLTDLEYEIGGMRAMPNFIRFLRNYEFKGASVVDNLHEFIYALTNLMLGLPRTLRTQTDTWYNDLERIGL